LSAARSRRARRFSVDYHPLPHVSVAEKEMKHAQGGWARASASGRAVRRDGDSVRRGAGSCPRRVVGLTSADFRASCRSKPPPACWDGGAPCTPPSALHSRAPESPLRSARPFARGSDFAHRVVPIPLARTLGPTLDPLTPCGAVSRYRESRHSQSVRRRQSNGAPCDKTKGHRARVCERCRWPSLRLQRVGRRHGAQTPRGGEAGSGGARSHEPRDGSRTSAGRACDYLDAPPAELCPDRVALGRAAPLRPNGPRLPNSRSASYAL
jgi:hypothetical protein